MGDTRVQRSIQWLVTSTKHWLFGLSENTSASTGVWGERASFLRRLRVRTGGSLCTGNLVLAANLPDGSRVRREPHARFYERPGVQFPRPTHPTVPVLAKLKTVTGRLWTYVRDDKPFGGKIRPRPSSNIRGPAPVSIRKSISPITSALCRRTPSQVTMRFMTHDDDLGQSLKPRVGVHWRRQFFDLAKLAKAPIAAEAVRRIDELFEIERMINGKTPAERAAVRRDQSKQLVEALDGFVTLPN